MPLFSSLYSRTLAWSRHPHAPRYLAGLSFAESSFFPIPPDVMLAPLSLATPGRAWYFAAQAGAFAYLLFILLYSPCVATIGAIRREAGPRWAAFVVAWSTSIAFISASLFYQIATYEGHPGSALGWIVGLSLILACIVGGLRYWSLRLQQPEEKVTA